MDCFKIGKLEICCKNAAARIESTDYGLHSALLWKKTRVMLFNATLAEEFAHTLDIDWKPLILRRGEEIGALANAAESYPKEIILYLWSAVLQFQNWIGAAFETFWDFKRSPHV